MHAGRNFTLKEALWWTRRDILKYIILAAVIVVVHEVFEFTWLAIPWVPMALIGTAVAFLIGFKNNATYDRLWEARKIWGAIVNSSRTWGMMSLDFVSNQYAKQPVDESELKSIHQRLLYRHVAWLTALRHQLRKPQAWEYMNIRANKEFQEKYPVPEDLHSLEDDIKPFLSQEDYDYVMSKKNRATHLVKMQSKDLRDLKERGLIDDFRHMEMENMLSDLYIQQGKCERIKNFPYPRQFATLNLYFVQLFVILLPFGLVQEFNELGEHYIWLTIPFSTLVSWVFHTMEKIGESTENPFQGGANDIPMAALSRTIEIDLREMLDETDLPEGIKPVNQILM